jgi:hypothetical protein
MSQISIPKPCHENWDNMLPETQGKHCLACSKTVIDFSNWEQDQILEYLQSKSKEKVCGRFNADQVEQTEQHKEVLPFIISSNISLLKKIAAIVLLCFGVMSDTDSYAQKLTGEPAYQEQIDTSRIMGKPSIPHQSNNTKTPSCTKADTTKCQPQIMGMIKQYPVPKTTKIKQPAPDQKNLKATPKK